MADNTLYLYTSLTAGSSHIVTATARLETILKANKLPFQAIDIATDDTARKLWGRRSRGRKLPGLVKSGMIVGDLEEIEEWNEYGELRMQVNNVQALDSFPDPTTTTTSSAAGTPTAEGGASGAQATTQPAAPKQSTIKIQSPPSKQETKDSSVSLAMRQASEEAASKAKENKANAGRKPAAATSTATSGAGPAEKEEQPETEKPESESATATTTAAPTSTAADKKGDDDSVRRKSIIGEIAGEVRRPKLVPEDAAVSSANLHADNPAALREHHRTSIVSATSKEERDQVAQDLRKSISGGSDEMLESLRKGHGHSSGSGKGDKDGDGQEVRTIETIPQDPFEDE